MQAYERLIKYAKIYTTSDPKSETTPSTKRQFDLANILVEEMKEIGIQEVRVDENCYVYGIIPATKGYEDKYSIGLIAHMDTAPAAPTASACLTMGSRTGYRRPKTLSGSSIRTTS